MAVNTTMTTNIGPIERPISPDTAIASRPGITPSAPFQPETQVDIENSIKSMLALLSKAEIGKGTPVQKMPEELQKLVNDLLKNSFSVDSSLAQGLNNMLQSQRFSVEQLTILAKFVEQLSSLVDAKESGNLSAPMKTLLANLILLDGNSGKHLDSVNLTKLAFQLLEGKPLTELPEVLQFLLLQNPGNLNFPPQQTNEMNFLKQLIQFFLPQASEAESMPAQGQGPSQSANQQAGQSQNAPGTSQGQTGTNQAANPSNSPNSGQFPSPPNFAAPGQSTQGQTQNQGGPGVQPGMTDSVQPSLNQQVTQSQSGQAERPGGAQAGTLPQNTGNSPNLPGQNTVPQPGMNPQGNPATAPGQGAVPQPGANQQGNSLPGMPNQPAAMNPNAQEPPQGVGSHSAETLPGQTGANTAGSPAMQNTPAMLQLMKNMAGQLMNKGSLTDSEFNLLRNFVNQQQEILDDQEIKQLQILLRMSEQNIPVAIRQAAARQNLSELPKLWAFVQLCNLSRLLDLPANRLRNASKNVNDFASMLKKSTQVENGAVGNQRSISFMTPLYMGENDRCYPAYIHLYHEGENESGAAGGEERKETWLRLCLMTEHIGAVELIFRLYEQENINLRLSFSDEAVAESFQTYIPELESAFEALPLNLTDIKVLAIGG